MQTQYKNNNWYNQKHGKKGRYPRTNKNYKKYEQRVIPTPNITGTTQYICLTDEDMLYIGNFSRFTSKDFQIILQKMVADFQFALRMEYDDFWKEVLQSKEGSFRLCLSSCLTIFPRKKFNRHYRANNLPQKFALPDNISPKLFSELVKKVLFIYHRIFCDSRQNQKQYIYEEWLADIPKIFSIMDIYGDSNPEIVQQIVSSIFQITQYGNDVGEFLDNMSGEFLTKILDQLNFQFTAKLIYKARNNFNNSKHSFIQNLMKSLLIVYDCFHNMNNYLKFFPTHFKEDFLTDFFIERDLFCCYFKFLQRIGGEWEIDKELSVHLDPIIHQIKITMVSLLSRAFRELTNLVSQCSQSHMWQEGVKTYYQICKQLIKDKEKYDPPKEQKQSDKDIKKDETLKQNERNKDIKKTKKEKEAQNQKEKNKGMKKIKWHSLLEQKQSDKKDKRQQKQKQQKQSDRERQNAKNKGISRWKELFIWFIQDKDNLRCLKCKKQTKKKCINCRNTTLFILTDQMKKRYTVQESKIIQKCIEIQQNYRQNLPTQFAVELNDPIRILDKLPALKDWEFFDQVNNLDDSILDFNQSLLDKSILNYSRQTLIKPKQTNKQHKYSQYIHKDKFTEYQDEPDGVIPTPCFIQYESPDIIFDKEEESGEIGYYSLSKKKNNPNTDLTMKSYFSDVGENEISLEQNQEATLLKLIDENEEEDDSTSDILDSFSKSEGLSMQQISVSSVKYEQSYQQFNNDEEQQSQQSQSIKNASFSRYACSQNDSDIDLSMSLNDSSDISAIQPTDQSLDMTIKQVKQQCSPKKKADPKKKQKNFKKKKSQKPKKYQEKQSQEDQPPYKVEDWN